MLIDDFSSQELISNFGTQWRAVSDNVMGGISEAKVSKSVIDERDCLLLSGDVRLDNNGGFIQASLDLCTSGNTLDGSGFTGIRIVCRGNHETYSLHLRTTDTVRSWQSYRVHFSVGENWDVIDLPFSSFSPHRLENSLDISKLRRIGLVAIGREFSAELSISEISFYN